MPIMPAARISAIEDSGAVALPAGKDHIPNPGRSIFGGFVLPDPEAEPSGFGEPSIGVGIAGPIAGYLLSPVISVCGGDRVMFRTPVPETAVEKDRHPFGGKKQVGGAAETFDRGSRDSIPETEPVDRRAQGDLGFRIAPPVGPHTCPHPFGRRPGPGHLPMLFRHASANNTICRWLSLA